ncbi:MAG: TetR/AcrR family transcriptional regulator [Nannocystaceae bacterium]|nr:TetR/AcrR family transcriptional regulator [Nannocystaceae bacterium]
MARRTPKGQRAREQILDAAEGLFADGGFHGTSVRDIAGRLGIPTASLLHHFPRKASLYGAVLERIAAALGHALANVIATDGGTSVAEYGERLIKLTRRYWRWTQSNPVHSRLLLRECLDNPARIGEARRLHLAPVVARFAEFIRAGQQAGAFRAIDPLMFTIHLVGSTAYFVAVLPTLTRLTDRSDAVLTREYRRDLAAMIERLVLVETIGA